MGTGGYRSSVPKWDKTEDDMLAQGIIPATHGWPTRARNWILGLGAEYDMETGQLKNDEKKEISIPQKAIVEAIAEVQVGKFILDRENDELTKTLRNPEKGGRTRGFGPDMPWKIGFSRGPSIL